MTASCRLLGNPSIEGGENDIEECEEKNYTTVCRYLSAAIQEEDDVSGYLSHVVTVFNQSMTALFLRVLVTLSAVAIFIIGLIRFRKCTLEQEIPLFLVLEGSVIVVKATLYAINKCQRSKSPGEGERNTIDTMNDVMTLFWVLWTLTGTVWVLGAYRMVNLSDPESTEYCDILVYNTALAVILVVISAGVAVGVTMATLALFYCHKHSAVKSQYLS